MVTDLFMHRLHNKHGSGHTVGFCAQASLPTVTSSVRRRALSSPKSASTWAALDDTLSFPHGMHVHGHTSLQLKTGI